MTIIRLNCKGRDLSAKLSESIATLQAHGPEWAAEIARARRLYEYCTLIHPSDLPTEEQIAALWPVTVRE